MNMRRGEDELRLWIARYRTALKKLKNAWMDLLKPITKESADFETTARTYELDHIRRGGTWPDQELGIEEMVRLVRRYHHGNKFPFNESLLAILFIVNSNLDEAQRSTINANLSMRRIEMHEYTFDLVSDLYVELICGPRTSMANPYLKETKSIHRARSFLCVDFGICENVEGYWAKEKETGYEGFLVASADEFWVMQEPGDEWMLIRFRGRVIHRGRYKDLYSCYGRKGRKRFTTRRSYESKDRASLRTEDSYCTYINCCLSTTYELDPFMVNNYPVACPTSLKTELKVPDVVDIKRNPTYAILDLGCTRTVSYTHLRAHET